MRAEQARIVEHLLDRDLAVRIAGITEREGGMHSNWWRFDPASAVGLAHSRIPAMLPAMAVPGSRVSILEVFCVGFREFRTQVSTIVDSSWPFGFYATASQLTKRLEYKLHIGQVVQPRIGRARQQVFF